MRRSRFGEEQIIAILREQEAGAATGEVCRRHWISDATFYIHGRLPRGKKVRAEHSALTLKEVFEFNNNIGSVKCFGQRYKTICFAECLKESRGGRKFEDALARAALSVSIGITPSSG